MYKTKEIEDLSIRLEAGEISPSLLLNSFESDKP